MWNEVLSSSPGGGVCGGLFQVTNEVLRVCTRSVSLDQVFEGLVWSSRRTLSDCIGCCLSWKQSYCRASELHRKYGQSVWKPLFLSVSTSPCFCSGFLLSAGTWRTADSSWWWTRPFRGLENCWRRVSFSFHTR